MPKLLASRAQQKEAFQRHIVDQQLAYQNAQLVRYCLLQLRGFIAI